MATAFARCKATGLPALRRGGQSGLVRPLGRRLTVAPRAALPGSEHIADLAAHAHSLAHSAQQLYTVAVDDVVAQAAAAATTVAANGADSSQNGGTFGFLADGFEAFLKVLEGGLARAGVPYSYGFAIILLTVMVKAATYPLTKKSMESTMSIQALKPRMDELKAKYENDPETLQLETARLYKAAGVNPLAGCLPTLATIPVFIGLYRALTKAADDGLLTSGFFWIPSLGGPTSMAMRQEGSGLAWLFPFVNGQPPVGWHDAIAYLVLPVLLIASQYASQKLVTPQSDDPAQKQTQAILGFLPFMIGWFSLNVPSGLTLYWFVNNIISTAMQLYMRNTIKVEVPALESAGAGPIIDVSSTVIKPKEDRSKQVSGKELGARKKKGDAAAPAAAAPAANQQPQSSRGQKFRARKSREAAAKAASQAGGQQNGATERQAAPAAAPTATSQQDRKSVV